MERFMGWMEENFLPIAAKIGSQKHLVAVRDAFIGIMPITMVGSVAVLLNVFLRDLPGAAEMTGFVETMQPIIGVNGKVWFGSIAILALVFVFSLGYNVAKAYDVNPLAGGVVAFASYMVTLPEATNFTATIAGVGADAFDKLTALGVENIEVLNNAEGVVEGIGMAVGQWGNINLAYTGAAALFSTLIVGLFATLIYAKLMEKNVTIKLPDTVPSAVSNAFAAIIPGVVAVYATAIVGILAVNATGVAIPDLITKYVQAPLLGLSQSAFSVVITVFFVQLFWFFGLHGSNVLAPILDGVYVVALNENTAAYELAKSAADLPHLWTKSSFDAYTNLGGSGMTLALIIAIIVFSKRDDQRTIAKLGAPMGVFNINEPITFGMPIVLNPIYAIPWIIIPPIMTIIAYTLTAMGVIPPTFVQVPWVMPAGVLAFLATGGNFLAALVALMNLFIAFLIWTPFVLLANRAQDIDTDKED